jgi:hypothetical protein
LNNNILVGETDYVKASEVQGESKEVGAKVMYQGRELTVREGIDEDGNMKMVDFSGILALAQMLKTNGSLRELKCVCQRSPALAIYMHVSINLTLVCSVDGHPGYNSNLEIMKLRGTEPVESIDLSNKRLTELSAIIIASLVGSNTATNSLKYGAGSKRSLSALSAALVSACFLLIIGTRPLTLVCSLSWNSLKAEGAQHVAGALAVNQTLTSVKYATHRTSSLCITDTKVSAAFVSAPLLLIPLTACALSRQFEHEQSHQRRRGHVRHHPAR